MTFDGFLMYLGSEEGSIFNPQHRGLYQDMSQPLCHYFISSSHNTYLMEDQLRGHSSVEGYIRYWLFVSDASLVGLTSSYRREHLSPLYNCNSSEFVSRCQKYFPDTLANIVGILLN